MIPRTLAVKVQAYAKQYPVVTITGPRQSGKSTLSRALFPDKPYVSLEDLESRRFAVDDPRGFLARYAQGAVIDEFQRAPDLSSYLQTAVDLDDRAGRFILTGSQQFELMNTVSQSLAGRTAIARLLPFSYEEIAQNYPAASLDAAMYRGFFPRIFDKNLDPTEAMAFYVATYVERDLRQIVNVRDLALFETFLGLLAGRSGHLFNANSLGNECGVSHNTIKQWTSVLQQSGIIHLLPPYFRNLGKRLIKAPKLFVLDTGLLCFLLRIVRAEQLVNHPLRGAIFESFVMAELLKYHYNRGIPDALYFYRDRDGREIDFIIESGAGLILIEAKSALTFHLQFTESMEWLERTSGAVIRKAVVQGSDTEMFTYKEALIGGWQAISPLVTKLAAP